jgi:large subunit ribosomal protein L1
MRGKKYREAAEKYSRMDIYDLPDSIKLVKDMAFAKFDETVEVAVRLNIGKSHTVRSTVALPNSFQKEKKILVFAKGEKVDEAKSAGAEYVGDDDLIAKIKDGWLDFDVAIATPDMMKDVGKLGPILGRRGLMPNPKAKTVTNDVKGAIEELKKGRMEFRADKAGIVHLPVGKVSMEQDKIKENVNIFISELNKKKPADIKGEYIKSISISSTMGPGVKLDLKKIIE